MTVNEELEMKLMAHFKKQTTNRRCNKKNHNKLTNSTGCGGNNGKQQHVGEITA
jgi:hypothetical protein